MKKLLVLLTLLVLGACDAPLDPLHNDCDADPFIHSGPIYARPCADCHKPLTCKGARS